MKPSRAEKRAKEIDRAIKLVWTSLITHTGSGGTWGKTIKAVGGHSFHKRAVRDYAELIKILADLY